MSISRAHNNLPKKTEKANRHWSDRLERVKAILACPSCHGDLSYGTYTVSCEECGTSYSVRDGKIFFIVPMRSNDALDTIKNRLKRMLGRLYYSIGITVLAPTYPFNYQKAIFQYVSPDTQLVIDIGCGNHRVDKDIITIDAVDYDAVDIVSDIYALPFKSDTLDAFSSRSVLEHVPNLPRVVAEMMRCTRPGGLGIHLIPFLFPYHASPDDYQRLTHSGAAHLFKDFDVVSQRNATGPVTLFLLWLIEFLSTTFSLGNEKIKAWLYLLFCLLLFPIKFLDAPFVGRKAFLGIAPSILTVVRKR